MARHFKGMANVKAIIAAQRAIWLACDLDDEDDAAAHCWACGVPDDKLVRAHIVPDCAGGTSAAENMLLLCWPCHRDQPDGAPRDVQLAWLAGREHYLTRLARAARPVVDAMRVAAAPYGGDRLLDEWGPSHADVRELLRTGEQQTAGAPNAGANALWGVLTAFNAWTARHHGPTQGEPLESRPAPRKPAARKPALREAPKPVPYRPVNMPAVRSLLQAGFTPDSIAKTLRCSPDDLTQRIAEEGLPVPGMLPLARRSA